MHVDDEYAAHPRSSITASSDDADLVTDVHWNYSSQFGVGDSSKHIVDAVNAPEESGYRNSISSEAQAASEH
ncbi:MAG: hypothetical protein FRX49_11131 [Trebouxia sp. A1-2]|nr:MAG: hypothetical protein FRX49_11131 [Trebouxia sp. A1-2]